MKVSHSFRLIGSGTTPQSGNVKYYEDGEICWVNTGDLNDGHLKSTSKYLTKAAIKDHSTLKMYTPGTVLMAMYGATIGKAAILDFEACTNQACCALSDSKFHIPKFIFYWLLGNRQSIIAQSYGGGQPNISQEIIKALKISTPPIAEQQRIVEFLDRTTTDIDRAIAQKQRLIELLQEQKAILINQAVTKGLNPNVPMRDSGIEWLGEIPEHWQVRRAKYIFREVDERSTTGEEELLSVSHITGVTPRSEKNVNMFMAEDYSGSKLCHKDDLIINIMWAWMGALGVANQTGIVSPSYGVFRQIKPGTFNSWYLEHLLRSIEYVAQYNRISTGLHSSRLRLYPHMFLSMEILLPPKDEQDQIEAITIDRIREIDAAIDSIDRETSVLEELRSVLISQAVTGKVKV
jgi:type I restriction enzyme S subunit